MKLEQSHQPAKIDQRIHENILFLIISVSVIGFLLHLIWEYVQCSPLFIHLKTSPTPWSMIRATLGDVAIFWSSYIVVAAFRKSLYWPWTSTSLMSWMMLVFISAAIAEVIEYFAINSQLWTYNSTNPTISGVSVVPLFQMATINPLTLIITKKLLELIKK